MTRSPCRTRAVALMTSCSLVAGSVALVPREAAAWWRGGFYYGVAPYWYGPPVVYPPPVVYAPPPVIYAPPPVTYAPPNAGAYGQAYAQSCVAGPYVCPLQQASPAGAGCSCFDNGGRRVGGQAR